MSKMFENEDSINDLSLKADNLDEKLSNGESFFMDCEELEDILHYLMDTRQWIKARKVIDYGIETFPFESLFQVKKAELWMENRNFKDAISLLENILETEPNNTEILCLLGDCYFQNFQYKRALDYYLESYKLDDKNVNLILGLIHTYFILEKPNQTEFYIQKLVKFPQEMEEFLPDFMQMLFSFDFHLQAITYLKTLIDQNPYSYMGWYFLGTAYQEIGEFDQSLDAFEYCLAIDDKNILAYMAKSQVLAENGKYDQAIIFIENNIPKEKWDADLLCSLGECYEKIKNYPKAKKFYQKAIASKHPPADAYYGLALIFKDENQWEKALSNLLQAIKLDDFESLYHIEIAETYLLLGDEENCLLHYQKAITLDENIPEIRLDYAQACHMLGFSDLAFEALYEMIDENIADHRVYYRLASYAFLEGLFEQGVDFLHIALEKNVLEYPLLYVYSPFVENNTRITQIINAYLNKNDQ